MEFKEPQVIFELMDDKNEKSCSYRYLKFLALFAFIILIFVLVGASLVGFISPRLKIKKFNEEYSQSKFPNKPDPIYLDDNFYTLKKEEAFLKSKLAKSDLDSISISINIPDSMLFFEINGVAIYSVKIDNFNISPIFDCFNRKAVINCFSSPFKIKDQYATVVKEPIVIKKAPKDTIEANQPAPDIDTLKPKMVAYYLYLDKDITLDIRQSEKTEKIPYLKYSFRYNLWMFGRQLNDLFHLKLPVYSPSIQIQINCKDALALFRALPQRAVISIHL